MMIDTNAFLGPWPFLPVPARTGRALAAHLRTHGIDRALVSHLSAAFLPEPMPANRELFRTSRGIRALVPVPVINPSLAAWHDHVRECGNAIALRALRLMPAYHDYNLLNRRVEQFMTVVAQLRLPVIVQVRMEDERNRYHGLSVKGVAISDLEAFLARYPRQRVLCAGLYRAEMETLAKKHKNFFVDVSFAEYITTLEAMRAALPPSRIVLGTMAPLLSVRAQTAKLRYTKLRRKDVDLIGSGNARRLFSL